MKKDKVKNQEIQLNMSQIREKEQPSVVLSSIICTLSVLGMCMGFYNGFGLKAEPFMFLGVSAIISVVMQWSMKSTKTMKIGFGVTIASVILYMLICNVRLINGMTGISNQVITTINDNMAQANVKYVVSEKTLVVDMALASLVICAVVTILFNLLLRYRKVFLCVCMLLGSSMVNMLYKGEGSQIWVTYSLVCMFIVMYFANIRIPKGNGNLAIGSIFAFVFSVISICFVLFVHYSGIKSVDDLKEEIIYYGENVVYRKSDYPEGQLKRFHIWEYDDEVRLKVNMPDTEELYLKGYVGSKFTEKGWVNNDENVYGGDYTGMIDWFRSNNFYPLTQTSMYLQYSLDNGLKEDKVQGTTIFVQNLSARKKYQYVTENLAFYNLRDLISPKQDVNFVEQDLFGENEYCFDIYQIEDNDYLNFTSQSWFENETDGKEFIQAEHVYHSFANQFYMDVPESEKQLFDRIAPDCNNNVKNAIPIIRQYLKSQITYSEEVKEYDADKNYVEQVLEEDQRGYSPQFATIATLMFRYYGIPARYVEGYYVTNEALEENVEVLAEHAHAWVEIYIQGFGFIPVEVTPGFYVEENGGGSSTGSSNDSSSGGGGTAGSSKKEDKQLLDINYLQLLTYLLILLAVLLVVVIIVIIIRRMVICKRRKKRLSSGNPYEVIAEAGCYIDALYKFDGKEIKMEIPFEVKCIFERTKFSNHLLKKEELQKVLVHMQHVLETTWANQKLSAKLDMLFVKCLR